MWQPQVHDRLVVLLPTLLPASVVVFDDEPVSEQAPQDYVTVGYAADDEDDGRVESYEPDTTDGLWVERGSVRLELVSASGNGSLADTKARVWGWFDALVAHVRTNPRIGVLPSLSDSSLSAVPRALQSADGPLFSLAVTFTYLARS